MKKQHFAQMTPLANQHHHSTTSVSAVFMASPALRTSESKGLPWFEVSQSHRGKDKRQKSKVKSQKIVKKCTCQTQINHVTNLYREVGTKGARDKRVVKLRIVVFVFVLPLRAKQNARTLSRSAKSHSKPCAVPPSRYAGAAARFWGGLDLELEVVVAVLATAAVAAAVMEASSAKSWHALAAASALACVRHVRTTLRMVLNKKK